MQRTRRNQTTPADEGFAAAHAEALAAILVIDGVEYATKEAAATLCREYAAMHPGSEFHNYAHTKVVRTDGNHRDLYEWDKLFTDNPILIAHPELKGMWRQRQIPEAK